MHDEMRQAAARRITEEAAQWLLANREGLDDAGRAAFMGWLRHSPAHVAEYMAIMQWDQDMREAAALEPLTAKALVAQAAEEPAVIPFQRNGHTAHVAPRAPRISRARRWPWAVLATAASLAAAMLVVLKIEQAPPPGVVYTAPANATRSLELDDGSRIQLDRGSAIRVNLAVNGRDIAVLNGTMLIDVGHASAAPLSVSLGRTVLRDIGTAFQVSAKQEGGDVTVLSGRVDILAPQRHWPWASAQEREAPVIAHLQGGQRATLAGDGRVTRIAPRIDVSRDLAWLPGEIDFHDAPVTDVARRFNDYGQAPVLIEDPSLGRTRISGRFHARDPAGFIAYLETLRGVQVRRDEAGIHVGRTL